MSISLFHKSLKTLVFAVAGWYLSLLPSHAQDRLVVVSPHWEGVRFEIEEAFKRFHKAKTGRDVEFSNLDIGGTSDILRFVKSEFTRSPAGINVDLFFGGNIDVYQEFKDAGYLTRVDVAPETLEKIPSATMGIPLYDPEHYWFAPMINTFGIFCNLEALRRLNLPTPQSFTDLTSGKYRSWIGVGDPRKSGSAHMAFEIILQAYGWQKGWKLLHALAGNFRSFSAYSAQVPQDVATGEVACGLSIDSYALTQIRSSRTDQLKYIIPDDAHVVSGDAVAAFKGAPQEQLAKEFVEFTLGKEAQRILMLPLGAPGGPIRYELGRLSVLPEIYEELKGKALVDLNPFTLTTPLQYDSKLGAKRWNLVNDLMGAFLIEPRITLSRLWQDAIQNGNEAQFMADSVFPPYSEDQAAALSTDPRYKDPVGRSALLAEWLSLANTRYSDEKEMRQTLIRNALPGLIVLSLGLVAWLKRRWNF